jgi:NitT/TauT family transport system ATP-binding protein
MPLKPRLVLVTLAEYADAYPKELSGGMKQRVGLARALAVDPTVLLMDEPFGSVDAQTRRELQRELLELWRETDRTVVFVTHDIDEAVLLGDRVLVMANAPGRIREGLRIDLPRPRDGTDERVVAHTERVMELIDTAGQR